MRLCMFHPEGHPMERGWVGRIVGDRVIHLAAQTLQSFFTGGGSAREHAEYPLADVRLLAPVLHPPAVRVFDDQASFAFANPAAIVGPGAEVARPPTDPDPDTRSGAEPEPEPEPEPSAGRSEKPSYKLSQGELELLSRVAAVIGADGEIGGFTALCEWRDPSRLPPKDRDFALVLGPVLVTCDELDPAGLEAVVCVDGAERLRTRFAAFDWSGARDLAAAGTSLRPGDLLAGPALDAVDVAAGSEVELAVQGVGVLAATLAGAA